MADEAITGVDFAIACSCRQSRFAVSREFDAKSTNACWLGFESDGLA